MKTSRNETKVEAFTERLIRTIIEGTLPPGSRLRSVRDAAEYEKLAVNTIVEAYSRLVARGYVESRPSSGYYVRKSSSHRQAPAAHVTAAMDVVSLLREQLEQHYEVRVGDGRPPASWMEGSEMGAHLRRVRSESFAHIDHGYGTPWGYPPLRDTVVRLLGERTIHVHARQVLLTQGANHALDLIVRRLLEPGDKALVDSPGYYPLFGKLKLAKVEMLGVPRMDDGPDLDVLRGHLERHRPKVFFTQSLAHNPTGSTISLPKAHKLLQLAAEFDCLVVEDDPFADFFPATAPRLAALDQLERVIYVSSFSKTLSAGLRVGYIAGSAARIQDLCDLKMLTVVSTSDFVERAVHQLILAGHYRRHLNRVRTRLTEMHRPAVTALDRAGVQVHPADPSGYYIWVQLPASVDELTLVRDAGAKGIFLAPGSIFYPNRKSDYPAMRVNVAYATDPRFLRFLSKVGE